MTWIVGAATIGMVAIFGDTAVSYGDAGVAEGYGVQKVGGLSQLTAVGFAGSVEIAFGEIGTLARVASEIGPRAEVPQILSGWYEEAVATYRNRYSSDLRGLGCELILVGASDEVMPEVGLYRSHGYVIRMPRSDEDPPPLEPLPLGGVSIGSGSHVPSYVDAVRDHALKVLTQAFNMPHAVGFSAHLILGAILQHTVASHPVDGVTETLVGAVITHDGVYADTVSRRLSDLGSVDHPTPQLARSMEDLRALEKRFGLPGLGHAVA